MRKNWTREETIIAFNVYCKIPFKNSSAKHPLVIEMAKIIGRSPAALNMKIGNIGRLDPSLKAKGITGLKNGAKLEEDVWAEFTGNWDALAFESERLIEEFKGNLRRETNELLREGKEIERIVKLRVNQSFFRQMILSGYNKKCCITGISHEKLLIASHIIPWSENKKERLNPTNGLCLNALHDKAFDSGLISVTPKYKILISSQLKGQTENIKYFKNYAGNEINLPDKFLSSKLFLEYHNDVIFLG